MSWQVDFGAMKEGYFKREIIKSPKQLGKLVKYFNNKDVYLGCYYKLDRLMYGDFYLDFDCDLENDFSILKEEVTVIYNQIKRDFNLSDEHLQLYFSGAKGFHLIVAPHNLGFSLCNTLNEDYKKMAFYYKKISSFVDTKIYDDRRVFRMPNSINSKTGLYKIPLTYDELILSNYKMICELAQTPRVISSNKYISNAHSENNKAIQQKIILSINKEEEAQRKLQSKVFNKELLSQDVIFPCIDRMLDAIHSEGERNKRLIIIASHLLQKGISLEETTEYLSSWNQGHLSPPLDEREVSATVNSANYQLKNGKRFGCKSILEIGECDFECRYTKREDK